MQHPKDAHRLWLYDVRNHHSALERRRPQLRRDIVSRCTAIGEFAKAFAKVDDSADVAFGDAEPCAGGNPVVDFLGVLPRPFAEDDLKRHASGELCAFLPGAFSSLRT